MAVKKDDYAFLELMNTVDAELIDRAMDPAPGRSGRLLAGRKIACAAAVVLVFLGCMFHTRVAEAIGRLTTQIARFWDVEEDLTPYTDVINTSQTKDGFTLTLGEVILSDNQLVIAADLDSVYPKQTLEFPGYLMIDGKRREVPDVSYELGGAKDAETDNRQMLITCTLEDGVIPDRPVGIGLYLIACKSWEDAEELAGLSEVTEDTDLEGLGSVFYFEFRVSGGEMAKEAVSRELSQEIEAAGGWSVTLDNITLNNIYSRISATLQNSAPETEALQTLSGLVPDYYLEGEDSLGNQVCYWMYSAESNDGTKWNAEFVAELRGGELPSTQSEWMDLRLFTWQDMGEPDTQSGDADWENGNTRNLSAKVYLGEKFRIYLK